MKEDDPTSIKAKEELDLKTLDNVLGLRDGDDIIADEVRLILLSRYQ